MLLSVFLMTGLAHSGQQLRPSQIQIALDGNERIFYFGVGSNMLKSKVINRGLNGSSIKIESFGPAVVDNHRLAFNMRGFPPIEPAMGGIEPCEGTSCHGALMEMEAVEYQKLWLSEGGGQPQPGYQEIIVDATPYGSTEKVQAIALQAAQHTRLVSDAPPSKRYMGIILSGAQELNLVPEYIRKLNTTITAQPSAPLTWLTKQHMHFTGLMFRLKWRWMFRGISKLLWTVYASPQRPLPIVVLSEMAMGLILLPGAVLGTIIEACYKAKGQRPPSIFGGAMQAKPDKKPTT